MSAHLCHARGCKTPVPRRMLMCRAHWAMVPRDLQERVWATYQEGQEEGRAPVTEAWQQAACDAIDAVVAKEAAAPRESRPIRGFTLHRPWPHAIVHLGKRIENRSWAPPPYILGGYLAIHAGKTFDEVSVEWIAETFDVDLPRYEHGHPQGIVAVARLAGVALDPFEDVESAEQRKWWVGPVGWVLDDVRAIDPVPCRGAQGLWTLPPAVLGAVRERYAVARAA
jgi:hypothetical protein